MPDLPKPRKSVRYSSEEADAIRRRMEAYRARILEEERNIQQIEQGLAQLEHDKAKATYELRQSEQLIKETIKKNEAEDLL